MRKLIVRRRPVSRRQLLISGTAFGAMAGLPGLARGQAPAIVTSDRMRPQASQGVMSGDVTASQAVIWSRADRPAQMIVEYATTEQFTDVRIFRGAHAIEATDFTTRAVLLDLPADQQVFYRVTYLDLGDLKTTSAPVPGKFRTAPAGRRDIRFQWSGDTAGQGWGINPGWGGMKIYDAMRNGQPDFFIHSGDNIYADGVIPAEVKLADGSTWKNITTEEKSKVAETLDEFRGAYRYNLMDANVRAFNADVPQIWQWDDHETMNNWSPSKDLSDDPRYKEKRVMVMAARAGKAFREYAPMRPSNEEIERVYRLIPYGPSLDVFVLDMRSYRGPNGWNRQPTQSDETAYLGRP
ncbi:MAG TPA: alkaline phosphatase D family protein, partial [Alphaproteobacteria bacterium]|nr:alkaline phosphatase D family protein [Alphaproteobacteria bacterium]